MAEMGHIPFNIPFLAGGEQTAIIDALSERTLHGDGRFGGICQDWFKERLGVQTALMTPSCSLALDLAMLLLQLEPGDEVLVPDFAFVTTAQCVALRSAVPVFCDIRADTLNIDESRLEEALTPRTKAIIPVHYGGVCAEMDAITSFAKDHDLRVVEDAAQAIGCTYKGREAGSLGDMAAFSFHATKNIQCAEGGMFLASNADFADAAPIAWEKGTDRRNFMEGRVDKYQWMSLGTSFAASELNAAMLSVQLAFEEIIRSKRLGLWHRYLDAFQNEVQRGVVRICDVPAHCTHNGHLFYLILPDKASRDGLLRHLHAKNIGSTFHYVPLHDSIAGCTYGRIGMALDNAVDLPHRLIRLPLFMDMSNDQQHRVIEATMTFLERL